MYSNMVIISSHCINDAFIMIEFSFLEKPHVSMETAVADGVTVRAGEDVKLIANLKGKPKPTGK